MSGPMKGGDQEGSLGASFHDGDWLQGRTMTSRALHCLTFDVEEHFQITAFDSPSQRQRWDQFESRVERNTLKLLGVLARQEVRATFFVLGWIAERHPGLVREIAAQGHEVASHGYAHELIWSQSPAQFREDVRKTKGILEDLIAAPVLGYRAPTFSITTATWWALSLLVEEGYVYDSSIFPIVHDRYGVPDANPFCHCLSTASGPLWELPPSTVKWAGLRVPIAGGGYFRLFPYGVLRRLLKRVETMGHPLITYLHPWELDPHQARMQGPLLSRFRTYVNLHKTEGRLVRLLRDFAFAPIREVVAPIGRLRWERSVGSAGPRWVRRTMMEESR